MRTIGITKNLSRGKECMNKLLSDAISGEKEAIMLYTFMLPFIHNGNHRRSILHILKEEKEHLKILEKIKKEVGE